MAHGAFYRRGFWGFFEVNCLELHSDDGLVAFS